METAWSNDDSVPVIRPAEDRTGHVNAEPEDERLAKLHKKLLDWFWHSYDALSQNRKEQAVDADYRDGVQWSDDEVKKLSGKSPVCMNEIGLFCDWLAGVAAQNKVDYRVLPRQEGNWQDAEIKGDLMKFVDDDTRFHFVKNKGFTSAVNVGVGWLECGVRGDEEDQPVYDNVESWRNIIYDHLNARNLDEDGRFIFRVKPVELDLAKVLFPDKTETLEKDATTHETIEEFLESVKSAPSHVFTVNAEGFASTPFEASSALHAQNKRKIVWLFECWYRDFTRGKRFLSGPFKGMAFNAQDSAMSEYANQDTSSLYDSIHYETRVAIISKTVVLSDVRSPYRHNKFPFTPIWAHVRDKDGACYGIPRKLRSAQDYTNRFYLQALFIMGTNQIEMEEDALPASIPNALHHNTKAASSPNGVLIWSKNALTEGKVRRVTDRGLAGDYVSLAQSSRDFMMRASGVTDENLGRDTSAVSGKAILAKQQQGSLTTAYLFENLSLAVWKHQEKKLSLIEQYFTRPQVIRVAGEKGARWIEINKQSVNPDTGGWEWQNDITKTRADVVISETPQHATFKQMQYEQMAEVIKAMPPDVSFRFFDILIQISDIPGKDDLLKRYREVIASMSGDDPAKQESAKLEAESLRADIEKKLAEANRLRIQAKGDSVRASGDAMNVGGQILMSPQAGRLADIIESGAETEAGMRAGHSPLPV